MIREVWEETGLTVEAPKLGGLNGEKIKERNVKKWNSKDLQQY